MNKSASSWNTARFVTRRSVNRSHTRAPKSTRKATEVIISPVRRNHGEQNTDADRDLLPGHVVMDGHIADCTRYSYGTGEAPGWP